MYQHFSNDLSTQHIYANGNELATMMGHDRYPDGTKRYLFPATEKELVAIIRDPVLVSDINAILNQIKEYAAQQTALALIGKTSKITAYDGLEFTFEQEKYPKLRGPNIDTLFFCRGLGEMNFSGLSRVLRDYKSFLEIGTGSGFIGRYMEHVLHRAWKKDYKLTYNDINPQAEEFYYANNRINWNSSFVLGSGLDIVEKHKFDMVVCNPPYIPRPNSIEDNAYEGLWLVIALLEQSKDFLNPWGTLLLNISSLGMSIVDKMIWRLDGKGFDVKVIDSIQVPLKVFNVLNNKERLNYLKEHHDLYEEPRNWHHYRHGLSMFQIKKQ